MNQDNEDSEQTGIPGYYFSKNVNFEHDSVHDPIGQFEDITQRLLVFVKQRDSLAILAKSGAHLLIEQSSLTDPSIGGSGLQQAEVELLQVLVLVSGKGSAVPTSPRNMMRLWTLLKENLASYVRTLVNWEEGKASDAQVIGHRARLQTLHYRNVFNSEDAKVVVPALLSKMDQESIRWIGYRISDFARALFDLFYQMNERMETYASRIRAISEHFELEKEISNICSESTVAKRAWHHMKNRVITPVDLSNAGFQLSEFACAPIFIFRRADLEKRYGVMITSKLYDCAIALGALKEADLARVYLDNPVWSRPFILLDDGALFLPIPGLLISFPFLIIEKVIGNDARLIAAYSDARSKYLEQEVNQIIKGAMPSAKVYTNVKWKEPNTSVEWEHDVVAVLGNSFSFLKLRLENFERRLAAEEPKV